MHYQPTIAIIVIDAFALLAAVSYGRSGWRELRCDPPFAPGRFAVSFVAVAIAVLVGFRVLLPVVGYAILCLALVSVYVYDAVLEERTRRRRVASLTPRSGIDWQLIVWIAVSTLSIALLSPYIVLDEYRVPALIVALCSLVMSGIAWRIATAPVQLEGDDIAAERRRDRFRRIRKTGLASGLAIGIIFVFTSFVNADLRSPMQIQFTVQSIAFFASFGIYGWMLLAGRIVIWRFPSAS